MDEQEQVGMNLNVMRDAFDLSPHSTLILDSDFRVRATNRAFCQMFGLGPQEADGVAFIEVIPRQWDLDALAVYLRAVLNGFAETEYFDGTYNDGGRQRTRRLTASRLESGFDDDEASLLVTMVDISELGQVKAVLDQVQDQLVAREQDHIGQQQMMLEKNVELADRGHELEALNRDLESFAYSVAHDLRAPLRTVHGFSEAIVEDYGDSLDEKGREYLDRILSASENMARLIEDLLSLSRVSQAALTFEEADLSNIVHELVGALRDSGDGRTVDVTIVDRAVQHCDTNLMRIALDNLIRNAWKFTQHTPQAQIEFGFRDDSGMRVYFVRDNGAGFDPNYADKLFLPFHRLHSMRDFPGTGLGLSLAQRIITRHGGRMWADGKEDEGATFYFSLPSLQKDE